MAPKKHEKRGTNGSPSGSTNEQKTHERRYEGYIPNRNEQPGNDDPSFVLDIPVLNIDELDLEVNDLRAHVSLRAELADLVKINVGVDIHLDKVKLGIKGVEAQALLAITLDRALSTLDRALEAIDKNPQILSEAAQDVDQAVGDASRGVSQGARETEQYVDRTPQLGEDRAGQVGETTKRTDDVIDRVANETEQAAGGPLNKTVDEAGRAVERAADEPRNVAEPISNESNEMKGGEATVTLADLQIEEEYVDEWGRIVGRARDESGNIVEQVLNEEGDPLDLKVPEEAEDQETEEEDTSKVRATDAAERKARELGVRLSEVKGTGSRGRILVKDVQKAAR